MNTKSLELDLKQIMQGLEEFATFMSYQSNYEGLRILKVETQQQATSESSIPANVISIQRQHGSSSDYQPATRANTCR